MTGKIRKMKITDFSESISLWQSLPGLALSDADTEDGIRIFLENNPDTCFIAEEKGRIIGTVLGGSDSRRGYIYHLAVHKDVQHMGLGSQLTQMCLEALRIKGVQKCHIFVISDNLDGQHFWEKTEWVRRDDILVMSKNL